MSRHKFLTGFGLLSALCLLLVGCKGTKEIPVYIHDTIQVVKEKHDSTFVDRWHTHYEYIKGDTIYNIDTFYHNIYKEKQVHDTSYISKEIPVPYPVEKVVEKELNPWQKATMVLGNFLIFALIGVIVYKLWLKKMGK